MDSSLRVRVDRQIAGVNGVVHASRTGQLLLLTCATLAGSYSRSVLGPLQETMRTDLLLSDNQMAWLQGPAIAIPMTLGSIPLGLLADRGSRAHLFAVFVILGVAANVLTAFASTVASLFMARCMAGLASAAILILVFSILSDLFAEHQRGRAMMVTSIGEIAGGPVAFGLGGALLTMSAATTLGGGPENWRWSLLWMCTPLVLTALLMLLLREPVRTGISVKNMPAWESWPRLWQLRALVVPMLLARVMVWIADGGVLIWAAPTFARRHALPASEIGAIMAAALLTSSILGPVLGGALADLCQRTGGPRRTMTVMCAAAVLSVPAAFFPIMPDLKSAGVMLAAFLTLGFTIGTAALSLATIVVPGELRGLYLAVTFTLGAVFTFGVAPVAISTLSGFLGGGATIGQALAIVCVVTSALGALAFAVGRRYFPGTHSVAT